MGPHLFYALQWWSFIGIAAVGYVVLLRREARAARSPSENGDRGASGLPERPAHS
jgi:cytochrome oxidase assembly protein ShyY1